MSVKIKLLKEYFSVLPDDALTIFYRSLGFAALGALSDLLFLVSLIPILNFLSSSSGVLEEHICRVVNICSSEVLMSSSISLLIISTFIRVWSLKYQIEASYRIAHLTGTKILENNLLLNYEDWERKDSATVTADVLAKTNLILGDVSFPLISLFASGASILLLTSALVISYPFLSIISIAFVMSIFLIIVPITRSKIRLLSVKYKTSQDAVYRELSSIVKLGKDIRYYQLENYFLDMFKGHDDELKGSLSSIQFLSATPRYLVEGFGIAAILLIGIWSKSFQTNDNFLASMGILAIGFLRILPHAQNFYQGFVRISSAQLILADITKELQEKSYIKKTSHKEFNSFISFKNINYSRDRENILQEFNLTINKGEKIALMGPSGSGKSTVLGLLSGLLIPSHGELIIDGKKFGRFDNDIGNRLAVFDQDPQFPNRKLKDVIILPSIKKDQIKLEIFMKQFLIYYSSLGLDKDFGTWDAVKETMFGDSAGNLSGGQKQRLKLAQILALSPDILLLDEPTSALDFKNSQKMLDTLMKTDATTIVVTHEPNVSSYFDKVYLFEGKELLNVTKTFSN